MVDQSLVLKTKIDIFKAVLGLDPQAPIFAELGRALIESGDPAGAIEVCRRGLSHHPDLLPARVTLIEALMAEGRVDEARQALEEARSGAATTAGYINRLNSLEEKLVGQDSEPDADDAVPPTEDDRATSVAALLRSATRFVLTDEIMDVPGEMFEDDSTPDLDIITEMSDHPSITFDEDKSEPLDDLIDDAIDILAADDDELPEFLSEAPDEDDETPDSELASKTLAELYVKQGLTEKARLVYLKLLEEDPDNPELLAGLQGLDEQPSAQPGKALVLETLVRWRDNIRTRRQAAAG